MSIQIKGQTINSGVAFGKIFLKQNVETNKAAAFSRHKEIEKFKQALNIAKNNIENMISLLNISSEELDIYNVQLEFLSDIELQNEIISNITENVSCEDAILIFKNNYLKEFENLNDEKFFCRFDDIESICENLINIINHRNQELNCEDIILFGEKIYPLDILKYRNNIKACISKYGSHLSHTSILCKNIDIPYIIGIDLKAEYSQKEAFVNGDNAYIIIEPQDQEIKTKSFNAQKKIKSKIKVSGCISDVKDIQNENNIGLCRTEFLFMEFKNPPNIKEQLNTYQKISKSINNKQLKIRTFDFCLDKQPSWLTPNKSLDDNYRSIKVCLDNVDIFKTQIKAIMLANSNKNISILFPFINTSLEMKQVLKIYDECKKELKLNNLPFNEPQTGAMIETKIAMKNVHEIAKLVDFISIGTNDLTKSLYGIDRESNCDNIDNVILLDSIKSISKQVHRLNKRVCVCGELASDFSLLKTFEMFNIDELVVPWKILNLLN